jgi:hypothetical protein
LNKRVGGGTVGHVNSAAGTNINIPSKAIDINTVFIDVYAISENFREPLTLTRYRPIIRRIHPLEEFRMGTEAEEFV